jgi:hypothetical protein
VEADDQMRRLEFGVWWMSRQAIAAVLVRTDLASGERLVALSLASFAGRENRAWPGAPAASARAGLSRSRYQQARERLIARGLVVVDERATGRGRASTVTLVFADTGPWWDGEINVELFETVLAYSPARGPERLLLATLAAVADEKGAVRDLSTEQLCAAAGVADRTYRRARAALLASGQLELVSGAGGRGNTNVWSLRDPRASGQALPPRLPRRIAPPAGARPLVAMSPDLAATGLEASTAAGEKRGQDRTLPQGNRPILTGVSSVKGGHDRTVADQNCPVLTGVSSVKGGQDQTLFDLGPRETPAQTPAQTPAPYARAGKEPQNPRTKKDPPSPPEGGSALGSVTIEQTYVTERGRRRRRGVRVDLDEVRRGLGLPGVADRDDWERIRSLLLGAVGESRFEIWLEPLELIAIDASGALVVAAPADTCSWVRGRFGPVLTHCSQQASRELRLADEAERIALARGDGRPAPAAHGLHINQQEVS